MMFEFMNMDLSTGKLSNKSLPMPEDYTPLEWKQVGDYEWEAGDYRVTVFMSIHEWTHEPSGDYGKGGDVEDAKRLAAIHAAIMEAAKP